ncbi:hypothetical protein PoB_001004400 [Plakobranchus ocellatus]|uniref:Uncharacterized protein n=1 Tax=Plakobranchus ocellatus TaxID=259542 RepID=A0AAV3YN47_9GAST|nr:hypothetical protein PoB_001004400 [Plakobranchus ocellatus]
MYCVVGGDWASKLVLDLQDVFVTSSNPNIEAEPDSDQKSLRLWKGVPASASSQPSHTITCSMFPWDDRGNGHPSDTTLLNTLAPVLVAHGLLTHSTTKLPLPATKRTKN